MIQIGADLRKTSGATGIRTPDLLHAIHARRVAQRRLLSPGKGLTCDDIRQASPHGARSLCTLAPILAPTDDPGTERATPPATSPE
jgi:hypothetical protein